MAQYLIYKWHYNGLSGFGKLKTQQKPHKIIESMQKSHYRYIWGGNKPGITWQTHSGDLVSAMVASSKL